MRWNRCFAPRSPVGRSSFWFASALTTAAAAQCPTQWTAMPGVIGSGEAVYAVLDWDRDGPGPQPPVLVAAGYFHSIGGTPAENIGVRDPVSGAWSPLGSGTDNSISALAVMPNGDLIVGGAFTMAGGAPASRVARWDGTSWSPLGSGLSTLNSGEVLALQVLPGGDLVAGGRFFNFSGPFTVDHIARWDGTSWSPLGAGIDATVSALALLANGDLVAGGWFASVGGVPIDRVARWDGQTWSALGGGISQQVNGWVDALVVAGSELFAGTVDYRYFSSGTPHAEVLRWDGAAWSPIGRAIGPTNTWAAVNALTILPSGALLAVGSWSGGLPGSDHAIYNGASWSTSGSSTNGYLLGVAALPSGEHFLAGNFTAVGGAASGDIASLTTTCPATVAVVAPGCAGSAGPKALTPTSLPWTGSTFRATASGLPAGSIAVSLFGLTASATPLAALVPQGVPGCTLHVSTESVQPVLPIAGTVRTRLVIPNSVAFAGVTLHHQVLAGERNAQGAITAVTATDAIALVIGAF